MTLDEKGNPQDNPSGDTPGTSDKDPETFTKESQTKAVSDALAVAGRDAKAMEAREKAVKDALSKAEKLQADIKKVADEKAERDYQADLTRAGDDPLQRSKVELDRSLKIAKAELVEKEAELSKRNEDLTDARKVVAESTKERNAREIASKYEVSPELLALTDGTPEAMEALAQQVSGKKAPVPQTIVADSSKTSGGSGLTPERVASMSAEEKFEHREEIDTMLKGT